jgi:hypothetical protein
MDPCKGGVLASSKTEHQDPRELGQLIAGYRLCARSEGKSKNTIDIVANSVGYFEGFLRSEGLPTDITRIGVREIRAFILYLQQKRCFSNHRFSRRKKRGEVLSQLEGKDVYISTYDVAQSSDVSISLLPLRLARQPYLCQKLQSALYTGNVDVLILTTRLPIDILSAYMIFAGFDSLQNHRFSPSHTTLMSAVNIDGVAGYIARFLRG